jgi:hypothetical protein
MPVHVSVPLLAPEAQHIDPLRRDGLRQRRADKVHDTLNPQVLLRREVADHVLPMLDRGNQQVAADNRISGEEGHRHLVPVDNVMLVAGHPGEHVAHEATGADPVEIRLDIPCLSLPAHGAEP